MGSLVGAGGRVSTSVRGRTYPVKWSGVLPLTGYVKYCEDCNTTESQDISNTVQMCWHMPSLEVSLTQHNPKTQNGTFVSGMNHHGVQNIMKENNSLTKTNIQT